MNPASLRGPHGIQVRLVLARDPELSGPRGQALRVLLYLFGRDEAVRYLRAG